MLTRRHLILAGAGASALSVAGSMAGCQLQTKDSETKRVDAAKCDDELYKISLAQWSLHRQFLNGHSSPLEFARLAKQIFAIDAIEYVNQFYMETLSDKLVSELKMRADDQGVNSLLIMVDKEGLLGAQDAKEQKRAVENHYKWADMAHVLGCHALRVNAYSTGSFDEQMKASAEGLNMLSEYCEPLGLSVIVENHGGLSSHGAWLAGVMKMADNPNVGTLPDFGNFVIDYETKESYDKYQGMEDLLPWAKAISAKVFNFDNDGNEPDIDFYRIIKMILDTGYRGHMGIEYEGENNGISEFEGIFRTKALLEKVRNHFIKDYV